MKAFTTTYAEPTLRRTDVRIRPKRMSSGRYTASLSSLDARTGFGDGTAREDRRRPAVRSTLPVNAFNAILYNHRWANAGVHVALS